MTAIIIIAGLACYALLTILRRDFGVYFIVLLLPVYQIRFSVFGIPTTFLEWMLAILAIVALVGNFRSILAAIKTPQSFWIALLLLATGLSVFISPVPIKAAGIWKAYFFEPVVFFFLIRALISDEARRRRLVNCIAISVLYLSMFGLYQFLTLENLPPSWWAVDVASRRITSLLNHPNALALLLGPMLAFLVFWPGKTVLSWTALVSGFLALYLSFSRASWLAILITTLIVGGFSKHWKKMLIAGVLMATLVMIVPFSREKILTLASGTDPSKENRYVLWSAAVDMLRQSPFFGVGLMGFHEKFKTYPLGPDQVVQNYPHNFFLNFWLETGFLGLVAIIAILIGFFRRLKKELKPPLLAAMLVILLHGLVDVPYFKNDLSIFFWMLLALS